MLEWLRIKQFQSHRESYLEFCKGLNVIVGISLHGKTAIGRAIGLLVNDRPLGAKYYSNFAPERGNTEIELKVFDHPNSIIVKKEVKKKNGKKELLSTKYIDGEFTSSGLTDQIKSVLNISELNVQKQFDQPFMIFSSAGQFSQIINRITKLDQADEWVKKLSSRSNKAKSEVQLLESQLKESENQLVKFAGIEDLKPKTEKLKQVNDNYQSKYKELEQIDFYLTNFESACDFIESKTPALSVFELINLLEKTENDIVSMQEKIELISNIKSINRQISDKKDLFDKMEKLRAILEKEEEMETLKKELLKYQSLEDEIESLSQTFSKMNQLESLLKKEEEMENIINLTSEFETLKVSQERLQKELDKFNEQIKIELSQTKECPLFLMPCPSVKEMMERTK